MAGSLSPPIAIGIPVSFIGLLCRGWGGVARQLSSSGLPKEASKRLADFTRAFEKGEMPTILDRHQLGVWKSLRDMLRKLERDEVVIAGDDQCRNPQVTELGYQIVAACQVSRMSWSSTARAFTMPSFPWLMKPAFIVTISFS
jgi:hypothetical protein